MRVVSNTSPVLSLAAIGRLDLLRLQFGEVLIPSKVLAELKAETDFRGVKAIRHALEQGWLHSQTVQDANLVRVLELEIDQGEAEAIALAMEVNSLVVLLDEHDGRTKARALGLTPVGVLGILLRAKRDGSIPSLEKAMQSLRHEVGFYIAEDLYQQVLVQAGEKR